MFIIVQLNIDATNGEILGRQETYPKGRDIVGVPAVLECMQNFDPISYAISLRNQAIREVTASPDEYIEVTL